MKRTICLSLIVALSLVLSGCDDQNKPTSHGYRYLKKIPPGTNHPGTDRRRGSGGGPGYPTDNGPGSWLLEICK